MAFIEPSLASSDPTLLSSIREEYHKGVVYLMAQSSCPGLSQEELMVFKEEFGPSAFVCHIRGCERSVVGYSTANGLRDHEARHQGLLKCSEASCPYNHVGFSSSKQLKAHQRKLHLASVQKEIPRTILRKRPPDHAHMGRPRAAPVGNAHGDLEVDAVAPHYKKTGQDWYAIFNPQVQRVLDVDLVHSLNHESVVCCVRFSHDGKYFATGCNRSAQIFDVQTGEKICVLEDHNASDMTADLYIRSVCFSPDGRYLATGADDKLIRVNSFCIPIPPQLDVTNTDIF